MTVALGIAAPFASFTVPLMFPVVSCPIAIPPRAIARDRLINNLKTLFILHSFLEVAVRPEKILVQKFVQASGAYVASVKDLRRSPSIYYSFMQLRDQLDGMRK